MYNRGKSIEGKAMSDIHNVEGSPEGVGRAPASRRAVLRFGSAAVPAAVVLTSSPAMAQVVASAFQGTIPPVSVRIEPISGGAPEARRITFTQTGAASGTASIDITANTDALWNYPIGSNPFVTETFAQQLVSALCSNGAPLSGGQGSAALYIRYLRTVRANSLPGFSALTSVVGSTQTCAIRSQLL
jgi:hypothetical protein